ncbi:MAG: WbqC family protein [Bacteroidales bacterium]|jgi:hypothetical protein|nr:WbqC family protein [Bacteroidales bacterium]
MISPLPTAYMPPVIYFAFLLKGDRIEIEAHETYQKQTWRNRCAIASTQGILDLTIPVVKPFGNRTKTKDVLIDGKQKWQNNHWRAITSAYNKSPYFLYFRDQLKALIYGDELNLLQFNHALMLLFLYFFKMEKKINFTTNYQKIESNIDLRMQLDPKKKSLAPLERFPRYYQVFSDRFTFFPNLSILDLAANEGPNGIFYLKKILDLI